MLLTSTYFLILYFACQTDCTPTHVATNPNYDTLTKCKNAGKGYLLPAANPEQALKTFHCVRIDREFDKANGNGNGN